MDGDVLVRDYLGRLEAAAAVLPATRRDELAAEVREHIDAALVEAGRSDEVSVRNVLERLGSPEEIVASEAGYAGTPGVAGLAPAPSTPSAAGWGVVEISAVLLLVLAWPASYLPFGQVLWLSLTILGLVLVWVSAVWTTRLKLAGTICVIALYLLLFLLTTPVTVQCTTGNPPQPCPAGGPSPIVVSS